MKTGKEGRTMSGKGVESVEAKSRNKSRRCPFRERKRGKRASGGRATHVEKGERGRASKEREKEGACRDFVEICKHGTDKQTGGLKGR